MQRKCATKLFVLIKTKRHPSKDHSICAWLNIASLKLFTTTMAGFTGHSRVRGVHLAFYTFGILLARAFPPLFVVRVMV